MATDENEKKLERLFSLLNPKSFTSEDFVTHFKHVLAFAKQLGVNNKQTFDQINRTVVAIANRAKSDTKSVIDDFKTKAESMFMESRIKAVETGQKQHQTAVAADIEDFKGDVMSDIADVRFDQDEHKKAVAAKIDSLGDIPAQATAIAEEINNKPKIFQIDVIEGLQELLDELKRKIEEKVVVGGYNGGFAGAGRGTVKAYDLSSQLNGVTTTFSLPAFWRIISVHSSSTPNIFDPLVDYSVDPVNMQITFNATITPSATLAAGQTLLVVYAET